MAKAKSEFSFIRKLISCQNILFLSIVAGPNDQFYRSNPFLVSKRSAFPFLKFRTIKDHAASANLAVT
ncbi:MAG: hypothetical protein DME50_17645, partial [Verrucomicrobia bacterium]